MKYIDQDGCERVNVSSGTGLPGLSRTNDPIKWLLLLLLLLLFISGVV